MSILTDKLPVSVMIDDVEVPINWDFRTSIKFSELVERSGDMQEMELIEKALRLYYPDLESIKDLNQAIEQMMWFYRCGKEERKQKRSSKDNILSYEHDAGYISAAFLEQYGIDFQVVEELHWWKFRALFESLKDDTQIVKIMGYRGMNTSKLSKEEKAFYKKMKKEYALPKNKASSKQQEIFDRIDEALEKGEDVNALLKELDEE